MRRDMQTYPQVKHTPSQSVVSTVTQPSQLTSPLLPLFPACPTSRPSAGTWRNTSPTSFTAALVHPATTSPLEHQTRDFFAPAVTHTASSPHNTEKILGKVKLDHTTASSAFSNGVPSTQDKTCGPHHSLYKASDVGLFTTSLISSPIILPAVCSVHTTEASLLFYKEVKHLPSNRALYLFCSSDS